MSRIKWEKALGNIATLSLSYNYPINIIVNEKDFKSNLIFLSCISNKVKNSLYSGNASKIYKFNCSIKDQGTYKILEDLFQGQLISNDLPESINTDLFEFALSIECPDLLEFYYEKYELFKYSLENFDKNVTYCKYFDAKDEFIKFVSQNIYNIGIDKLVETCNYLGYDFSEKIILSCLEQSIDFNEFISCLIDSHSLFFNLILLIDSSQLKFETKIKILHCYFSFNNKTDLTNESINQYILKLLPTITNEYHKTKQKIDELKNEAEFSKQEIDKLRKEIEISKQENDKMKKEIEISKQENDELRKEIGDGKLIVSYSGNQYDGIFSYLRNINNGQNPLTCGAISVTTSNGSSGNSSDLFEYSKKNHCWGLQEIENNSVIFDFKGKKVSLSAYTIKAHDNSAYWDKPVDFAIEGSNDFNNWQMIDNKPSNTDINYKKPIHTWVCSKSPFYRYIRFRLKSIYDTGLLYTDHFEFFGKIKI